MNKLVDNYDRKINYLRVSITDRCNLRCQYCMPPEGVVEKDHTEILRYEEIINIVRAGVDLGIQKVRITGGEPLVRKGIVDLISGLKAIDGLKEISMTTNGTLLSDKATALKRAGLDRVNISLDSLQPQKYRKITRRDQFEQAMTGIRFALDTGLAPVKINVVVMRDINDNEILDFVEFSREYPLQVRFIEFMPLGDVEQLQSQTYISLKDIKKIITDTYDLTPVTTTGNGPASYYQLSYGENDSKGNGVDGYSIKDSNDNNSEDTRGEKTTGIIGFINPISHKFCSQCNRLRLTADGRLKPCLASNVEVDMHHKKDEIGDQTWIKTRFWKALCLKPGGHNFKENKINGGKDNNIGNAGQEKLERNMSQIGG